MIILEGPDKAGKTTLAKIIAEELGGKYYHFGISKPGEVHTLSVLEAFESEPDNTVFDRCGLSALAYDFIENPPGKPLTSLSDLRVIVDKMARQRMLLIHTFAYEEDLKKRFNEEGDANNYLSLHQLLYVNTIYHLIFRWLTLEHDAYPFAFPVLMSYNSSSEHPQAFVEKNENYFRGFLSV